MTDILKDKVTTDGSEIEILIEVDDDGRRGYGPMRGERCNLATRAFNSGMKLIRACAEQVAGSIEQVQEAARPREVEVEFGIKLDSEVGALISRTGVEGHLSVRLKWSQKEEQ